MPLGHHHDLQAVGSLFQQDEGGIPSVLVTPPQLVNPTSNEATLLSLISHPCFDAKKDCMMPPILTDPTPCELGFLELLANRCVQIRNCQIMPFTDGCTTNLKKLILYVTPPQPGGSGGPPGGVACGPTGLPLSISTLDPNQLGEDDGEITCDDTLPEIRLTAAGGVAPYTWAIDNPLEGCPYGGVGGPSFGPPTADGLCNSRFVITAPDNDESITGDAYEYYGVFTRSASSSPPCGDCNPILSPQFHRLQCDDTESSSTCPSVICPQTISCRGGDIDCDGIPEICDARGSGACSGVCGVPLCNIEGSLCNNLKARVGGIECDKRTDQMVDDGCCPCTLAFEGLVVTVTDAIGTQVSITLTVNG